MTAKEISDLFVQLELHLIASLKRNLMRHRKQEQDEGGTGNVPEYWEAWQSAKLRDIRRFRRENEKILEQYSSVIDAETEALLQEQYAEGGSDGFFHTSDERLRSLIHEMQNNEARVERAALRYMNDVYRKTILRTATAMVSGGMTYQQATDEATKDFLAQGINCVVYANGRQVNIASYAEMALRTCATRAMLLGEGKQREKLGIDTVLVSQYGACSDTCLPWQGRVYIDDVFQPYYGDSGGSFAVSRNGRQYMRLSIAIQGGLFHPNCRHTISTWIEGISTMPTPMDPAKIEKISKLEKQQRALERQVRRAKREAAGLTDETARKEAKARVRKAQEELRSFIKENSDVLRRDYWRERDTKVPADWGIAEKFLANNESRGIIKSRGLAMGSSVNSDTELTMGSVCSTALECRFFTPRGNLNITVGSEVTLYKVDDDGNRSKVGVFTLQAPERPSRNTYKITSYDRVSWLDRDITPFLKSLDGWPYSLLTLAQMVCEDCRLTLVNNWIPNGNFPVNKFPAGKMTARELMGYIGQLCGRFCRATSDGDIEFAWYEDSGVVLRSTGERYFNTLKYEDYQVERIDIVQVQMAEGEYGLLFPDGKVGDNAYVISGNPLITFVNEDLQQYLDVLRWEIGYSVYTPCRVTLPACLDIRPGHIVRIIDRDDRIIDTYVMTKIQKGQKDTLESTGSARRDSPSVVSAKTPQDYADAAMKRQTQLDIFNKLTNYGTVQGLFLEENGQIFVNAAYISTGILQSKDGKTFYLDLDNGILEMDASALSISGESLSASVLKELTQQELVDVLTREGAADGIYLKAGQLYINGEYIQSGTLKADYITSGILKSKDGESFYLDLDYGTFRMNGTGKFLSPDGKSYMTMDGGSFVLRTQGAEDKWAAIAKIGYSEDSEGVDYPYMLMGHAVDTAQERNLTLVKAFSNGIYIGNAVPKLNTGKFLGLPGAVGFFVDIENQKTYNVVGDELYDAFTAVSSGCCCWLLPAAWVLPCATV